MRVIRVDTPLLWVEYEEHDDPLSEGDIFVIRETQSMFQVESVIPIESDGVILSLTGSDHNTRWPVDDEHVSFLKIRRGFQSEKG